MLGSTGHGPLPFARPRSRTCGRRTLAGWRRCRERRPVDETETRLSPWKGALAAAALPTVLGLIAAGQMVNEIRELGAEVSQLETDRSRLDSRDSSAEALLVRIDARIDSLSAEVAPRAPRLEKLEAAAA